MASSKSHSHQAPRQPRLTVEYISIGSLKPDKRNAREHSPEQIRQIADSIKAFGFNQPLLIDSKGRIICGHGRYRAAEALGLTMVSVIRVEHLTEAQRRQFAIADNQIAANATWNMELLAEQVVEFATMDVDFDLDVLGFAPPQLDALIGQSTVVSPEGDPADVVATLPRAKPVSRLGDLFDLGRHRIACDNALSETAYHTLMTGSSAAMIFTDPPYNVPILGHVSGKGRTKHRDFAMASGELTTGQFTSFLTTAAGLLKIHTMPGAVVFVCMDWRHATELEAAARAIGFEHLNTCVWVKSNAGMGSLYRSRHEFVYVFKNGKARHCNNVQLGRYGRNRSNVWEYAGANSFGGRQDEGVVLDMHPTVKPVAMIADAILDCSVRGDIILDPFAGVGSTLLAAERTGRRCYAIELEPAYVDHAIRRWQNHCGDDAWHTGTGKTFNQLARERRAGDGDGD